MKKAQEFISPTLVHRVAVLEAMNASARSRLPTEIAAHCWVGGYEKNHIVLVTDYPHYALYIRWHQREILKQLREEFAAELPKGIRGVRVKVSRLMC